MNDRPRFFSHAPPFRGDAEREWLAPAALRPCGPEERTGRGSRDRRPGTRDMERGASRLARTSESPPEDRALGGSTDDSDRTREGWNHVYALREPGADGRCPLDPSWPCPPGPAGSPTVPRAVGPTGRVRRASRDSREGRGPRAQGGDRALRAALEARGGVLGPRTGPSQAGNDGGVPDAWSRRAAQRGGRRADGRVGSALRSQRSGVRSRPDPARWATALAG